MAIQECESLHILFWLEKSRKRGNNSTRLVVRNTTGTSQCLLKYSALRSKVSPQVTLFGKTGKPWREISQ
jgi:hypothetical protein